MRIFTMNSRPARLTLTLAIAAGLGQAVTKGPDTGGYSGTDATVFSFTDISGAGGGAGVLAGIDDGTAVLTLPFAFRFYGQSYTLACVSSNGALYFISAASACNGLVDFANTDLTVAPPPGDLPAVLPFWTDLTFQVAGAGSVFYATLGTAGNRRFVVQWNNAYPQGSPNPVTFQVILFEANNNLLFQYQNVSLGSGNPSHNGARATIGVHNKGGKVSGQQISWSFDAPVVGDQTALLFIGGLPTATVAASAQGQYSDQVQLSATVSGAGVSGNVAFSVNGTSVGSAAVGSGGTATLPYAITLAAGMYPIAAQFTSSTGFLSSNGSSTLTVTREDAVVKPDASNPLTVTVSASGGTTGPFTLKAAITEANDDTTDGDTSKATPVTFVMTPLAGGAPISCAATTSGGGVGRALTATCAFNQVPVNVYQIAITVGGNFYTGSAQTTLAVVDPSLGFATGGGTLSHNSVSAQFQFDFKYQKDGSLQGSFAYSEPRPSGTVTLTGTAVASMSIVGNEAIIFGTATLNNTPGYAFRLTVLDNGQPAKDQVGLQVVAPDGSVRADLMFAPIALSGGNLQVHQ